MITKELLILKRIVKKILLNDLYSRDSDERLMFKVWERQEKDLEGYDHVDFRKLLINKKLFSPSSIIRTRSKTQELYPNTRGITYFERRKMQNEVKEILETYKKI